jgi:hypothetical protein
LKKEKTMNEIETIEQKLTKTKGIYFLYDKEVIVYIGSSDFCEKRIYDHIKDKSFDFFKIIKFKDWYEEKEIIEAREIIKYLPKYNKTIPNQREYSTIDWCYSFLTKLNTEFYDVSIFNNGFASKFKKTIKRKLKHIAVLCGIIYYSFEEMENIFYDILNNYNCK